MIGLNRFHPGRVSVVCVSFLCCAAAFTQPIAVLAGFGQIQRQTASSKSAGALPSASPSSSPTPFVVPTVPNSGTPSATPIPTPQLPSTGQTTPLTLDDALRLSSAQASAFKQAGLTEQIAAE